MRARWASISEGRPAARVRSRLARPGPRLRLGLGDGGVLLRGVGEFGEQLAFRDAVALGTSSRSIRATSMPPGWVEAADARGGLDPAERADADRAGGGRGGGPAWPLRLAGAIQTKPAPAARQQRRRRAEARAAGHAAPPAAFERGARIGVRSSAVGV
jgi:hypothetical protein